MIAVDTPDWPTVAAIYNGILASNMTYLPLPCNTGNCTYPVVPSLGVCGECQPLNWSTSIGCFNNTFASETGTTCNYTLPDGQDITVFENGNATVFEVLFTEGTFFNSSSITTPYILNVEAIGMPFNQRTWNESLISAQECALWYCVQSYDINITNNVLSQTVIETWNTTAPMPAIVAANYNITFSGMPESMNILPNSEYKVMDVSRNAASMFLGSVFKGQVNGGLEGTIYSTDWIEAVWAGWGTESNMEQMISNLARSMTNNIRSTSPASSSPEYEGTAFHNQVFVKVRWRWMVLPIILVICSVIFLITSIWQTADSSVNAWRSNAVPLLFSDIGGTLKMVVSDGLANSGEVASGIRGTRVVLKKSGDIWEFTDPATAT